MQTVVDGCAGDRVKCAKVLLFVAVQLRRGGSAAGGVDLLVCPILVPSQGSIKIGVLLAQQKIEKLFSSSAGAAAKAVAVSRLNAIAAESSRERNFLVLMKNAPFITLAGNRNHVVSIT